MKQLIAFVRKEFYHIFRDLRSTLILLAMPIVLIILFGYAITTEIRQVSFGVLDESRDELSVRITDRLAASSYFHLYGRVDDLFGAQALFRQGKVRIIVVFPPQFASRSDAPVQLLADASDPNEATQLLSYASAIIQEQWADVSIRQTRIATAHPTPEVASTAAAKVGPDTLHAAPAAGNSAPGIRPVVRLLYNPLMKGAYNFVPGVMGLILILICAMMTSVGIVREKETGTMEILLVSPLKPIYIILAKATPYLFLSLVNIATILLLSYYLLDVPIAGSLWLLVGISLVYAIVSLCLGLLISTIADTQKAAMLISGMALMLPVMLLSGMLFPVENMPPPLQWLSHIVPAKWYIIAVKDVMIKGLGLAAVWKEIAILLCMGVVLVLWSVKRFNIRL